MESEQQDSEKFDVEAFVEEGMAEAGIEAEPDETEQEADATSTEVMSQKQKGSQQETEDKGEDDTQDAAKAALESTDEEEEDEQEAESVIASLLPKPEEKPEAQKQPEQRVPVSEIVKERQRRQEEQRRREAAEQRLAEIEAAKGGEEKPQAEEKSPLEAFIEENPDEDFVPPKIQLAERKWQQEQQRKAAQAFARRQEEARQSAEAEAQRQREYASLEQKATTTEKAARKAHADYDDVTKAVMANPRLKPTNDEARQIMSADDPSEAFYQFCKGTLDSFRTALGIATAPESTSKAPSGAEQPSDEEGESDMTDDEIFEEVWGS